MSRMATRLLTRGMFYEEKRLAAIAHNIANSSTPGYKAFKVALDRISSVTAQEEQTSAAKNTENPWIDFSGGPLVATGGRLDFAIEGKGFFVVRTPHTTFYTRNGQFAVGNEKKLVTMSGYPVMGSRGEITIEGAEISVSSDGSVSVDGTLIDKLKIVDFKKREAIQPVGNSFFVSCLEDNEDAATDGYSVKQGFAESSNVRVMNELVNLIRCIRAYEAYDTAKQRIGEATGKLNEVLRF